MCVLEMLVKGTACLHSRTTTGIPGGLTGTGDLSIGKYTRCYNRTLQKAKVTTPGLAPWGIQLRQLYKWALKTCQWEVWSVPAKVVPCWPLNISPPSPKWKKESVTQIGRPGKPTGNLSRAETRATQSPAQGIRGGRCMESKILGLEGSWESGSPPPHLEASSASPTSRVTPPFTIHQAQERSGQQKREMLALRFSLSPYLNLIRHKSSWERRSFFLVLYLPLQMLMMHTYFAPRQILNPWMSFLTTSNKFLWQVF